MFVKIQLCFASQVALNALQGTVLARAASVSGAWSDGFHVFLGGIQNLHSQQHVRLEVSRRSFRPGWSQVSSFLPNQMSQITAFQDVFNHFQKLDHESSPLTLQNLMSCPIHFTCRIYRALTSDLWFPFEHFCNHFWRVTRASRSQIIITSIVELTWNWQWPTFLLSPDRRSLQYLLLFLVFEFSLFKFRSRWRCRGHDSMNQTLSSAVKEFLVPPLRAFPTASLWDKSLAESWSVNRQPLQGDDRSRLVS